MSTSQPMGAPQGVVGPQGASAPQSGRSEVGQIRVWDGLTRLTHWLLVALVPLSWWSAEQGHMDYHRYSGYALLGALVFRLFWGFFGSSTAR